MSVNVSFVCPVGLATLPNYQMKHQSRLTSVICYLLVEQISPAHMY